ncbi:MAG: WG repeat-containing protein, partial [Spirochaetaceae bacterium]|nr:WG repeat-containing protein [Spirochaetaceae bacterium]
HPDIVALIEYGDYKGRFYEILEYAAGGALDEKTSDGKYKYLPVTEATAEQIVKEVINAFDACHKAGIIHRDIKPGNLFYKNVVLHDDGKYEGDDILVGDFGISSSFDIDAGMSKHMTQTNARTDGYAAPEAYSGVIGPEWDYYSLGVTLWELLTGKEPFVNEKGQALYPGQIALDTMQGRTADLLLSRSPELSGRTQQLIRGLMTVRHDKRWGHKEVSRFLAGETVEVFSQVRDLPTLEIAGERCGSYKEIAQALIAHPDEGKNLIYKGKLVAYLIKIDQQAAEKMLDIIDDYSAKNELDLGLTHVAYSLCPNLPFAVDDGHTIASLQDFQSLLVTNPEAVTPWLWETSFYTYLEVIGLGGIGKKVQEIAETDDSDFKLAPRILVALDGNEIAPFQDGINNAIKLKTLEQLYNLPEYLKERVLLFIERKSGVLSAWIENMTGLDMDLWLYKLKNQEYKLIAWGKWKYFTLFLEKKDIQRYEVYSEEQEDGEALWGCKDPVHGAVLLQPIWEKVATWGSITDSFIVKKNGKWGVIKRDGSVIIPFTYIDEIEVFDEERGLYQVLVRLDEYKSEYQIITEKGDILYNGYYLKKYSAPGKPFDVIQPEMQTCKLLSKDFQVLKEAKDFEVYYFDGQNYVWMWNNDQMYICNSEGKVMEKTPYYGRNYRHHYYDYNYYKADITDLLVVEKNGVYGVVAPNGSVIIDAGYDAFKGLRSSSKDDHHRVWACVKKDGKWGIINARTGELIMPCLYNTMQENFESGDFYLCEKGGIYELYHKEDASLDKFVLQCKIKKNGNKYEILNPKGKICDTVLYIRDFAEKYDDDGYSFYYFYPFIYSNCLVCFDGTNFISFNVKTLKTTPREVEYYDGEYLLKCIDGKQLWQLINNLKQQNKIPEMNKLVKYTWEHFYDKEDWETARRILFFIKANNMEGLSGSYDYYRAKMAYTLQCQENYEDAVEYYEDAIERNPNVTWYYQSCSFSYIQIKKYDQALSCCNRGLQLYPDDPYLLNSKGYALSCLGKHKEAITFYSMAIEHGKEEKDKARYYNNRGHSYKSLGMQDKADADYRTAKKYE